MGAFVSAVSGVPLMEDITTDAPTPTYNTVSPPDGPGPTCGNTGLNINLQPMQAILLFVIAFGIGVFLALIVHFRTMIGMCQGCGQRGRNGEMQPGIDGEEGAAGSSRLGSYGRHAPPAYEMALTMPRPQRSTNTPCLTPVFVIAGPSNAGVTSAESPSGAGDPPTYETVIRQLAVNLSPLGRIRLQGEGSYVSQPNGSRLENIPESPESSPPPTPPRVITVRSSPPSGLHRQTTQRAPCRTSVRTTSHSAREDRYSPMDLVAIHTWF